MSSLEIVAACSCCIAPQVPVPFRFRGAFGGVEGEHQRDALLGVRRDVLPVLRREMRHTRPEMRHGGVPDGVPAAPASAGKVKTPFFTSGHIT